MSNTAECAAVERVRERARALGLADPPVSLRGSKVPEILFCTFDPQADAFHVVYADLTAADLQRHELADVGERRVVAWSVDEFRRGVEVAIEDGVTTSFSAEYPRYLRDPDYRQRTQSRFPDERADVALRVADRVRKARLAKGWSVAELARRMGMAPPNVHRLESGRHVALMATVLRLAAALEVPVESLVRR